MTLPSRLAQMAGGSFSTIWRGVAGALLCYITSGVTSWIVYIIIYFIHDDFKWPREIFSTAIGGVAGAYTGVWVLDHTLKRYPGRTIGWVFIGIWTISLSLTLLGVAFIVSGYAKGYKLSDVYSPLEIHEDISAIFSAITFYFLLVKPNKNLMFGAGKANAPGTGNDANVRPQAGRK